MNPRRNLTFFPCELGSTGNFESPVRKLGYEQKLCYLEIYPTTCYKDMNVMA